MESISLGLNLLGALAVFLYGLKVMSEGLQKAAGTRLRAILAKATSNRFSATFSGFLVTCAVQSSSATTVMVVGFCSAGLLTLGESLGVIFGANIGTTTTAWLVSLLGFKVKISTFALPIIGIGFFSQFITRWRTPHRVGEVLVGFGLLFLGLSLLREALPNVKDAPQIMEWITRFSPDTMGARLLVVGVGAILTMIFQSSSAMMAVTLTAAANGLIDFPTAAALVLGENIGTTITANLAAIGAPLAARRAARGHFFFNISGVIWAILLFYPFLALIDRIVPGDPYGTGDHALLVAIPIHLSAFHTVFNVTHTLLMLPLIKKLERFIIWLQPAGEEDASEHDLVFLSTPFASTAELVLPAAQKEVDRMAGITVRMVDKIKVSFTLDSDKLDKVIASLRKDEKTTDVLEHRINEYLSALTHSHLSSPGNKEAISLLSMINDLERIGDHGEKLAILRARQDEGSHLFTDDGLKDIQAMADKTSEILKAMRANILKREKDHLGKALKSEEELNALRDKFRQSHLARLSRGKCSPVSGIIFNDMLTSFEKMGDHAVNVSEACAGVK